MVVLKELELLGLCRALCAQRCSSEVVVVEGMEVLKDLEPLSP